MRAIRALFQTLLVLVVALSAPGATADVKVGKDTRITVVYVGAANCPYCREWETAIGMGYRRDFLASKEFPSVEYREVKTPMYSDTSEDQYWPDDLRWVRDKSNAKRGTPRFLVVVGDEVVLNAFGTKGWKNSVVPLIKDLAERKQRAS